MTKHQGLSAVVILIIIAFVALGGIGYYYSSQKGETPPPPTPPSTLLETSNLDTADWKTYTDSVLGLSFQYPSTWKEPERKTQSTRVNIDFGNGFSVISGGYYGQNEGRMLTINELVNSTMTLKNAKRETLNLAGKVSTKVSYNTVSGGEIVVYIPKDSQSDMVIINSNQTVDTTTFANILSSFGFTDMTTDASDWKTYRNDKYGFGVKYPPEWIIDTKNFGIVQIQPPSKFGGLTIHTEEISEGQSLDQFLEIRDGSRCEGVPCREVLDKKEIIVAGYPAIQRRESWSDCPCTGQATYFQWNNLVYVFSGAPINSSDSITEEGEIMYNQILSTFRFVE